MAERDDHKLFKGVVVILLLFITFFLGSLWFKMAAGGDGHMCPFSKMEGKKFCPITGKPMMPPMEGKAEAQ